MNALKYLISLAITAGAAYLSNPANAQILSIDVYVDKLVLPKGFTESLEKCEPYHAERPLRRKDVAVNNIYTIDGIKDDMCGLHITGITNSSVEIHQDCNLPADVAKTYAHVLQRFENKKYSQRWDEYYIEKDEDYQAAVKIMSDPKYCSFYREEIDNTQDIRRNLAACTPTEQTETASGLELSRQIIGLKKDSCVYKFTVQKTDKIDHILLKNVPPADSSYFTDTMFLEYTCAFSEKQAEQYLHILESEVIPAEEDFDYAAIWHISPVEELEFLRNNCSAEIRK